MNHYAYIMPVQKIHFITVLCLLIKLLTFIMSELCVQCGLSVTSDEGGIECDSCGLWQHLGCDTG